MRNRAIRFLEFNRFPEGNVLTRARGESEPTRDFKTKKLRAILAALNDEALLIGDDTQADPEAYQRVADEFKTKIRGTYIHLIQGRAIPTPNEGYVTTFDLAQKLKRKNFLTDAELIRIKNVILAERTERKILPRFQKCPPAYSVGDAEIEAKIKSICTDPQRGSKNETPKQTSPL